MSEHLSSCGVPHLVLERQPHRRALALGAVGLPGRERPRLARPVPGPRVLRRRPGRLRLEGAGRGLLRRLRGEDRGADPLRRRGDVRAEERRPARLPRRDVGRDDRCHATSSPRPARSSARSSRPSFPTDAGPVQIHSSDYRNPGQLPEGAVLVVGAGSSGVQIADELLRAGRRVYLSVGPHDRPPRRYRGRDFVWWLGVLGKWDAETPPQGAEHVTIAVSGADGGNTVDFRDLAARGMTLSAGRLVRRRRGAVRAGSRRQHREGRRQLPVAAGRGRRLRRPQRSRPPGGAGGAQPRAGPGLRDRSHPRARPGRAPE